MTDVPPNRSARILGQEHGLTAAEMNFLLKLEGFLEGEPGAYRLTPKGARYASEQDHHRGTGGYSQYNRYWETRTWDPRVTAEVNLSDDRKRQIREAAQEARRLKQAAAAVEAVAPQADAGKGAKSNGSGVDPLTVAVGVALAAVSVYGIKKVAPHLKALWTERGGPRSTEPDDSSGDATDSPDGDDDRTT